MPVRGEVDIDAMELTVDLNSIRWDEVVQHEGPGMASGSRLIRTTKEGPALCVPTALRTLVLTWDELAPTLLVKGNAQRLCTRTGSLVICRLGATSGPLLDLILTLLKLAPGKDNCVLGIECGHDLFPLGDDLDVVVVCGLGAREHVGLDRVEERLERGLDVTESDRSLCAIVTADTNSLRLGDIARADLETQRDTLGRELALNRAVVEELTFCSQSLNLYPGV